MMSQCRLTSCNKYTTLLEDFDNEEVCVGTREIWEISVSFPHFVNLNLLIKKYSFNFKQQQQCGGSLRKHLNIFI